MKAMGLVRRIDDLGRIIIPKEVRRILQIKDGEPFEIFIDEANAGIYLQRKNLDSIADNMQNIINFMLENSSELPNFLYKDMQKIQTAYLEFKEKNDFIPKI